MPPEVLVPESAGEAVSLFGDGDGVTVFGGGTLLMPELAAGRLRPARALLLPRSALAGLHLDEELIRIGAMVTLARLADGAGELRDDLLGTCARHIADNEVRASATVGGNIYAPAGTDAQRGDLGAALIALAARVRSAGAGGERTEPVEDFLAGARDRRLVLEVEIDREERVWAYESLHRRHAHSFAVASVAACLSPTGGLRVAVSGVGATAVRCRAVEESRDPGEVLRDAVSLDDAVASRAYRDRMLPLLVRRALEKLGAL